MLTRLEPARFLHHRGTARLFALALSASAPVHAQAPRLDGELWGHILTAGDSTGVAEATIALVPGRTTTTSQSGFYRLASLGTGSYLMTVRRLGYRSVTVQVSIEDSHALRQDVILEPLPQQLTEIRIEGRVRKVPPRFEDVYRRMSTATGSFFTREDIDRMQPPSIESLLERVGTVRVNEKKGVQFAKCNEGGNLALGAGGGKVQIYIDGLRMTGREPNNSVAAEQAEVLHMVNPSQIQALEVYSGVSRIPGQFLEDACAVIAIWTKAY
jgi:hypothetical protein